MSIDVSNEAATAATSGASATERFHADKSPFAAVKDTAPERVDLLARSILDAVHATIREHKVTYDEFNALKAWMINVAARTASGRSSSMSGSSTPSRRSTPTTARATRAPSRARTTSRTRPTTARRARSTCATASPARL